MPEKNISNDITRPSQTEPSVFVSPPENKPKSSFFKENKWAIYLIVLSLLAISGLLVFLLLRPGANKVQPKVQVTIDAPNEAASGTEVVYKVHFANGDQSTMQNVVLDLIYPQGFTFEDSTPKASRPNGAEFDLPNVDPSEEGTVMIRGTILGNADEIKSVSAIMHYKFANLNSDFVTQAQSQTKITQSSVSMQFDGPTSLSNGSTGTYNLTWANTSSQDFSGLKLHLDFPATFHVDDYSTRPEIGTDWNLGTLKQGDVGKLVIKGHFEGANSGDMNSLVAKISGPDQNGQIYVISSAQYAINITAIPLATKISVNSNYGQDQSVVNPGDTISYQVHYQNNNSVAVHGASLTVTLTGEALSLASIQASDASISGNTITWDASGVPQFNNLNPNDSGDLSFHVVVKDPATRTPSKNLAITAQAKMKSSDNTDGFLSDPVTLKVATKVGIDTAVSFAGGANPLAVGQPTTYLVVVSLTNTTNDVNNSVLTFNLPRVTNFDTGTINFSERSNVSYDPSTKKLTWNAGKLSAHLGDFSQARKLNFSVTITPNSTDNYQYITLGNNIRFSGTDSFTNVGISLGKDDILSSDDPSGGGTVTPQ